MKALDKTLEPLLKFLDGYYAKLPALPKNVDEGLVSLAPWLALIGGLLSLFAAYGLYSLMTSPYVAMFANLGGVNTAAWVASALVMVVVGILYFVAFPSLRARKVRGWNLMFYGVILYIVSSIVKLSIGDVVMSLIGALIGYYFLYQVKSYYK